MSENILTIEDLKFLEILHSQFGLNCLRLDENGIKTNENSKIATEMENNSFNDIDQLTEITKKLKFRLDSNFQLHFSHGFNFEVKRI
jgi:hypothetical protein